MESTHTALLLLEKHGRGGGGGGKITAVERGWDTALYKMRGTGKVDKSAILLAVKRTGSAEELGGKV